jgi:hypothetical protein
MTIDSGTSIKCNDSVIKQTSTVKDLGATINQSLSFYEMTSVAEG